MCHSQMVWFLHRFGLKTGLDFAHFSLESGMVFDWAMEVYECIPRVINRCRCLISYRTVFCFFVFFTVLIILFEMGHFKNFSIVRLVQV